MKKRFLKNLLVTLLVFLVSSTILYLLQQRVCRDVEAHAVERTGTSIRESMEEFYENLDELSASYAADLTGRAGTTALMLRNGDEDTVLQRAGELCKAEDLFIAEADGTISASAQEALKGRKAEEVLAEFIASEDREMNDHVSVALPEGRTLWLCDHSSALVEAGKDPDEFLGLGEDLNAFNASSARIILWSILLLGIGIAVLFIYGEYLSGRGITGTVFFKKSLKLAMICLCAIGIVSFYTQTLECVSSAIDTADNTGEVLTQIRAQHLIDTDYLDTYYEDHDRRRIRLIAACVEDALEETKSGTEHVYREAAADGLRKPVKDSAGREIRSYSDNAFLKKLMEINNLDEIFLTDTNGFTISSGTSNWYYQAGEVPGFLEVLDGRTDFYNDEHDEEGYRLNAVKCGEGILVIRRPWVSEDKNIRMRKQFIYEAAESSMNARLIQTTEEEEAEQSTNAFIRVDGTRVFRHRINARSLNEGNFLIAYYPEDFMFRSRRVMIYGTILVSVLSMLLLIFLASRRKPLPEEEPMVDKIQMEAGISVCLFLTLLLICFYSLQGLHNGESASAIRYIMDGDWPRGLNFFSLSACAADIFGALLLQQLVRYLLRIGSSDLETYQKERFHFAGFILSILIFLAALFLCLYQMGLNLSGLFASAGILSAVVGFASQNIIGNYFDGVKNMYDDTYRVGEMIRFNDFRGKIVDMTATYVLLKDGCGNIMKVNHRDFVNAVNLSRNASMVSVRIPVAADTDISRVEKALEEALPGMNPALKERMIGDPFLRGVSSTDGDGKDLVFYAGIREENRDFVQMKLTSELIDIVNRAGIGSPTPVIQVIGEKEKG